MRRKNSGFTLVELLIVVAVIGILAAIAIPNLLTAIQRAKQKRTMTNMRNLATAWEARANDFSMYNAAGIAGADEEVDPDDLDGLLTPTYIKTAEVLDGWGREMKFYMDVAVGDSAAAQRYVMHSSGRDGTFEDDPPTGQLVSFDCDILYSNGAFLSYPPQ